MKIAKIALTLLMLASATMMVQAAGAKAENKAEVKALKKEMMTKWKAYCKEAKKGAPMLTIDEFLKWEKQDKEFILVDVREPDEVAAGVIPSIEFKAIPRGMVAPKVGKALALKPSDTIVFYCKLGCRSAMVAKEIKKVYGYKNVYFLEGGITEWIKRGYEIHNKMGEFVQSK